MGVRIWLCMCLLAHCVQLTSCYSRKLLYSSSTSIMEFDFDTSNVTLLVELDRGFLFAMDYDYKNKFMYFPRYLDEDIVRFAYPSKNITLQTVIQSLSYPSGIAVDSTNDHIYWIDIGTHGLSRCNLDGSNVMLVSTYNYPYVVRIDVTNRWLYVVENNIGIWKSQFHLPAKQKILNFTSTSAYCMDIDTEENRLYWINYEGDIKSAKDDGSDIKTIFSTLDQRIFRAIRVIGTNIYYAHNNQLLMISKTPGSTPTVLYFDSGDIHSMFVLNEAGSFTDCKDSS